MEVTVFQVESQGQLQTAIGWEFFSLGEALVFFDALETTDQGIAAFHEMERHFQLQRAAGSGG